MLTAILTLLYGLKELQSVWERLLPVVFWQKWNEVIKLLLNTINLSRRVISVLTPWADHLRISAHQSQRQFAKELASHLASQFWVEIRDVNSMVFNQWNEKTPIKRQKSKKRWLVVLSRKQLTFVTSLVEIHRWNFVVNLTPCKSK